MCLGPELTSKAGEGVWWEKGLEHQEGGSKVRRIETHRAGKNTVINSGLGWRAGIFPCLLLQPGPKADPHGEKE